MDGSVDQLMRLLSNRGLEWLRQHVMALPDPCPLDHPDLDALAMIGQIAPVLSGLRGRISPIEVIVTRRLTPALVRAGALRVLAGARDPALVRLMLAGGLVAQADPLWQLACEALAGDASLPLQHRLALCDDPALLTQAEGVLTTMPDAVTTDHVAQITGLLMQLYHHGARRPCLSHPRKFTLIFDHLLMLSDWAQGSGCTASVAAIAFSLHLLDDDSPVADLMSDLIQVQRPDGSFPAWLGFGTSDQTLSQGVVPTLMVSMALHMAAWRRWQGPPPIWLQPSPLGNAARILADRIAAAAIPHDLSLHVATSLTRATGRNWLVKLSPPRSADPAQIADLARICFRDPTSARHLRAWLTLPRHDGPPGPEAAWLMGNPVTLTGTVPTAVMTRWTHAADVGDAAMFRDCARIASHHAGHPDNAAIRGFARHLTVGALTGPDSLPRMLDDLDLMTLLSQVFEPEARTAAAA